MKNLKFNKRSLLAFGKDEASWKKPPKLINVPLRLFPTMVKLFYKID